MIPEQANPPEDKPSIFQRLLDYVLKNPFLTLWNVALLVGGMIALFYFAQLGYLPDFDPKSAASTLIAIATLGCVLVAFLTLVFIVPAGMIRGQVWKTYCQLTAAGPDAPAQPVSVDLLKLRRPAFVRAVVLHGLAAYFSWGVLVSCVAAGSGYFSWALLWSSLSGVVICTALLITNFRWVVGKARLNNQAPEELLGHSYKSQQFSLLMTWLLVAPGTALMILLSLGKSGGDNIGDIILSLIFVAFYLAANAVLAVHDFQPPVSYLAYPVAGVLLFVFYLILPANPVSISQGAFSIYAVGALPNTAFIVKRPACDAVNSLAEHACQPIGDGTSGCIKPKRMASRIGNEFLLILSDGSDIKVPLQKSDVLVWGATANPKNLEKSCAVKSPMPR
jgi:hypothetical protein